MPRGRLAKYSGLGLCPNWLAFFATEKAEDGYQFSAAIAAIREIGLLTGLRVARSRAWCAWRVSSG
jgi:hypothetical protein